MKIQESQKLFGVTDGNNIAHGASHLLNINTEFHPPSFLYKVLGYDSVDCIVYTFNCKLIGNEKRISNWRIIASKLIGEIPKGLKYKLFKNVHTKLYICYNKNKLQKVYIGSQNFNSPTYLELMYSIREQDFKDAKEYFEYLWMQ